MKKVLIILMALILFLIVVSLIFINDFKDEEEPCYSITGGGYNIIFNTNSDIDISSMHVCIACPPDSYEELPIPEKEGYEFLGWYYDKELTKKVESDNSLYVNTDPKYAKEDCIVGYNDVNLYAKWEKLND